MRTPLWDPRPLSSSAWSRELLLVQALIPYERRGESGIDSSGGFARLRAPPRDCRSIRWRAPTAPLRRENALAYAERATRRRAACYVRSPIRPNIGANVSALPAHHLGIEHADYRFVQQMVGIHVCAIAAQLITQKTSKSRLALVGNHYRFCKKEAPEVGSSGASSSRKRV